MRIVPKVNKNPIFIIMSLIFAIGFFGTFKPCYATDENNEIKAYRLEVDINVPPEFLYPYLIFEDKIERWQKDDSVVVTFPNGIEPRIGKRIRIEMKFPTHPWMLMEITKLEPGRLVQTNFIDGVLDGNFSYILKPNGSGGTHFVHEMRIRPVGALVSIIWEVHGKRLHHSKMKTYMAKIKDLVEADYREFLNNTRNSEANME